MPLSSSIQTAAAEDRLSALGGAMDVWVLVLLCVAVVAVGYSVGNVLGFVADRHRAED